MMMKKRVLFIFIWMVVAFISFSILPVLAQDDYPNRPIEIIIPWAPGGPTDLATRFFADKMAEFLGQPVVPINKAGGVGTIGTRYVARAKPDGYTLLSTSDSQLITGPLERKDVGYNFKSFQYPVTFGYIVTFFSVKSDSRWKTLNDFLDEAKKNPGKLKYATMGPKHQASLATDMICKLAGAKLTLIPFKSTPDCLTALIGGNVDMAVTNGLVGFGGTGKIRVLATMSAERLPDCKDVPTVIESGYPIKFPPHLTGIAVPAETPEKVSARLIEAHKKVCVKYSKEIEEKMIAISVYPIDMDPKSALEFYKEKEKLFKEYYDRLGVKPE